MNDPRQSYPQTREERWREDYETMERWAIDYEEIIQMLAVKNKDWFLTAAELARKQARRVKADGL